MNIFCCNPLSIKSFRRNFLCGKFINPTSPFKTVGVPHTSHNSCIIGHSRRLSKCSVTGAIFQNTSAISLKVKLQKLVTIIHENEITWFMPCIDDEVEMFRLHFAAIYSPDLSPTLIPYGKCLMQSSFHSLVLQVALCPFNKPFAGLCCWYPAWEHPWSASAGRPLLVPSPWCSWAVNQEPPGSNLNLVSAMSSLHSLRLAAL